MRVTQQKTSILLVEFPLRIELTDVVRHPVQQCQKVGAQWADLFERGRQQGWPDLGRIQSFAAAPTDQIAQSVSQFGVHDANHPLLAEICRKRSQKLRYFLRTFDYFVRKLGNLSKEFKIYESTDWSLITNTTTTELQVNELVQQNRDCLVFSANNSTINE